MSFCAAEELALLCHSAGRECAFPLSIEEDPYTGPPNVLLTAGPKDMAQLKHDQMTGPQRSDDTSQHSEDEDGDLLWCPSPTFPTMRAMVPTAEAAGATLAHPELSSSSNSDSSMSSAFDLGRVPGMTPHGSAFPHTVHLAAVTAAPLSAGAIRSAGQSSGGCSFPPRQQQAQLPPEPTAAGARLVHPKHAHARPSSWHHLAGLLKPPDKGSPTCEGSHAATFASFPHGQEASHAEGGGRISPDLSATQPMDGQALKQEQQQAGAAAAPAAAGRPASNTAGPTVQSTRHTKRTPVPSVRLQRIMEGESVASPSSKRPPQKKKGGKRSAEEQQLQQQQLQPGEQQNGAGPEARRIKPRLLSGADDGAAALAAAEDPVLHRNVYLWPDDEEEVMSGSKGQGGGLMSDDGSWQGGLLCDAAHIRNGYHLLHAGMPMQANLPAPPPPSPAPAMWAPAAFPAHNEEALGMGPSTNLQLPTDLLEVAAELAAAADTEDGGHGICGSVVPDVLAQPTNLRCGQHPHSSMMINSSTHARLQGLGHRSRPLPQCNASKAQTHHGQVRVPVPPQMLRQPMPPIKEGYDGHEDKESGLPQVPPPKLPAGQPRGAPRPPARVLVPHPTGGCCTACKVTATPVWRTGPHGPKTLCNACGVRYTKVVRKK